MSNTFNETFFEFSGSIATLEDRAAELREEAAGLDEDNPRREALQARAVKCKTQRKGAVWARDTAPEHDDFPQWDEPVDGVTLGALRSGAYASLEDDIQSDPNAGQGTSTNLFIAEGTVEAPYIDESMDSVARAGAVAQLHPFYKEWAEARINELMDPEAGNGTRSGTSQPPTSGETTSTGE